MKPIIAVILALFINVARAEQYDFKIVKLTAAKSFYRESPPKADIGTEIQTFFASSDLYKVRRDQWIFLVIDDKTGKLAGIGMEFQDGYDYKHIPKNKIVERKAGRFVEYSSKKTADQAEIQKQLKKYMADNKLKLREDFFYLLLPAIKVKDEDMTQTFIPIE